jgi:MFS family permease
MALSVESPVGGFVLRVMVPLGAGFFLSNFYRSLNAVLSPYLIADLHLSARELGLLTSVYFFTSAIFQAPLGLLMDRYGPRLVQGTLMVLATLGILMFALSSNLWVMIAGRAIMGIGAAGALMTAFQAIVLWSPPPRWPALNGWIMAAGGLGSLVATAPAELVLHVTSWHGLMLIAAAASLATAIAILILTPERAEPGRSTVREQIAGLLSIYRDRLFWRLAPLAMTFTGCNFAFVGLWAGPWLKDVGGYGPDGIAVSLLFVTTLQTSAYVVSGKIAAALARRGVRLTQVIGGMMALSMLLQLPLLLPSTGGAWVVLFAIGAFSGATALAYPVLNGHFPPELSGRVSTALNLFVFVGAFVLQYAVGAIIDLFAPVAPGTYPAIAYEVAFGVMILVEFLSWLRLLVPARQAPAPEA